MNPMQGKSSVVVCGHLLLYVTTSDLFTVIEVISDMVGDGKKPLTPGDERENTQMNDVRTIRFTQHYTRPSYVE